MNWKNEAMDRLRQYDAMRLAVANLPQEIRRLELASKAIRSARTDGDPVRAGGGRRREEAILANMMTRQELQWRLEQARRWLAYTDRALEVLNPEEKMLLERFFIYPQKGIAERLCSEMGVESSSVYRKRDKALQRFTVALYGGVEH